MRLPDAMKQKLPVSFEVFPPKTDKGMKGHPADPQKGIEAQFRSDRSGRRAETGKRSGMLPKQAAIIRTMCFTAAV